MQGRLIDLELRRIKRRGETARAAATRARSASRALCAEAWRLGAEAFVLGCDIRRALRYRAQLRGHVVPLQLLELDDMELVVVRRYSAVAARV